MKAIFFSSVLHVVKCSIWNLKENKNEYKLVIYFLKIKYYTRTEGVKKLPTNTWHMMTKLFIKLKKKGALIYSLQNHIVKCREKLLAIFYNNIIIIIIIM